MDIRWLQDFLAVAETGNFTRAAENRNVSQAAFSRRIQSLESWLGVALIDRSVFPTRLTPEGEQFRQHAGDILRQVIDARRDVADKAALGLEHIRIALPFVLATARLPHWWQAWASDQRLSSTVVLGNIHDLVTALTAGNADLMFCYLSDQQPVIDDTDSATTRRANPPNVASNYRLYFPDTGSSLRLHLTDVRLKSNGHPNPQNFVFDPSKAGATHVINLDEPSQ